ncbi:hypothetical protein PM082_012383 [Marasmius tenuissimus]|nr:hypothetical protein PM082_012383 [Marasmius tenuissimus]
MAHTVSYVSNGGTHRASHANQNSWPHAGVGISPQALVKVGSASLRLLWKVDNIQQQRPSDVASLSPGIHLLPAIQSSPFRQLTPQEIMTTFVPHAQLPTSNAMRRVQYLERCPDFRGSSIEAPVTFTVHGDPGPYLWQLVTDKVSIDGPRDLVFANWGKPRLDVALDFPGIVLKQRIQAKLGTERRSFTRQEFAKELAMHIFMMINDGRKELKASNPARPRKFSQDLAPGQERWRWDRVKTERLRLISINLYGRYWVPVLAADVE